MKRVETVADVLVTAAGYEQLRDELEHLRTTARAQITAQLRAARDEGTPDDPALYELFEARALLEDRIALLAGRVAEARVVEPPSDGIAGIGSLVRVRDRENGEVSEYELVGAIDPDVGNGRVSVAAPVGRALLGVRRGDSVAVETPRVTRHLEVLDVARLRSRGARSEA